MTAPRFYMDNAATSFPKPEAVHEAMAHYAKNLGASPGRGAYFESREAGRLMNQCRTRINQLINGEKPEHVVFTLNTSDALNLGIRGILKPLENRDKRQHVITSWMDHNSVLRPLNALSPHMKLDVTRLEADPATGLVDPADVQKALRPETRLIALVHGSNVTGTLQHVRQVGQIARAAGVPFLVDAAQSLGHVPIDVQADCIDLLAFPGHKGLLGPLGTGALYIRPGIEKQMATVREGGTGSISEQDVQPDFMPDRFEPGSHNAIGIIGLSEGVQWILNQGVAKLWEHQVTLMRIMLSGLNDEQKMPGLTLYGPKTIANRCAVFSVRVDGFDLPQSLSDVLEKEHGILTRSGIHCAPLAHRTFGTHTLGGMTRFSFGPFTQSADVHHAVDALSSICLATQARLARR